MKSLFSILLLLAALAACSSEPKETPAAAASIHSTAPADSISQPAAPEQDLGAQSLKTTQEVDSLLNGI